MVEKARQRKLKIRPNRPNLFNISPKFFGENLKKILDENKISQADLAHNAHLSTDTISSYVLGGSIDGKKSKGIGLKGLVQITQALNHLGVKVNLHDLLGLPDIKNVDKTTAKELRIEILDNIENLIIRRNGDVIFETAQESLSHKFVSSMPTSSLSFLRISSLSMGNIYSKSGSFDEVDMEDAYAIVKGNLYKCLPGGEFAGYDSEHDSVYDYLNDGGEVARLISNYSRNRAYMGTLGEFFNPNEFVLLCYMLGYIEELED